MERLGRLPAEPEGGGLANVCDCKRTHPIGNADHEKKGTKYVGKDMLPVFHVSAAKVSATAAPEEDNNEGMVRL